MNQDTIKRLSETIAIVLAAGRGTRMGGPKALMPVGGRPWWKTQADRLEAAGVPALWVVSAAVEAGMRGAVREVELERADDAAPMLASIIAGVRRIAERRGGVPAGVFVLPIDVPAPSQAVWRALASTGAEAAAPALGGKLGHPVFLSWGWVETVLFSDAAASEAARLDELMRGVVRAVPVADPDVRVNLNTPQAVAAWLARCDEN